MITGTAVAIKLKSFVLVSGQFSQAWALRSEAHQSNQEGTETDACMDQEESDAFHFILGINVHFKWVLSRTG